MDRSQLIKRLQRHELAIRTLQKLAPGSGESIRVITDRMSELVKAGVYFDLITESHGVRLANRYIKPYFTRDYSNTLHANLLDKHSL